MLTFGSLFAGIGGFDLGLERAGMRCKWQVEINPYAQAVLKKHWPDVARHDDVTTFPPEGDWSVDVICGGFPCQDISVAGKGAGLSGARSGLWYEFARIIRQIRPQWVIVENVRAFTSRGIDTVLGQMADLGYDAEWHCIPACAVGAPHRRERIWIVAHAVGDGCCDVADAKGISRRAGLCKDGAEQDWHQPCDGCCEAIRARGNGRQGCGQDWSATGPIGLRGRTRADEDQCVPASSADWWVTEPDVGRVAHGVPSRVDRLRCLGNAVVPQIVEIIGRAIIAAEGAVASQA